VDYLGESPIWDANQQALYWLDLVGQQLHTLKWGKPRRSAIALTANTAAISPWREDRLVALTSRGVEALEPSTGRSQLLFPAPWSNDELPNDAKCDPLGNFWFETKDRSGSVGAGAIYRLSHDGETELIERGFGNINGFGWSPDGTQMYVTDTRRSEIYTCTVNPSTGRYVDRKVLVRLEDNFGRPDGLTVDREVFIWSANWDGGSIMQYDPKGSPSSVHAVEARCPTSCMFGGPRLDKLFVTFAIDRNDQNYLSLVEKPLCLDSLACGRAEASYAGEWLHGPILGF